MSRSHLSLIIIGLLIVSPPLWFYASGRAWIVSMPGAAEWAQELVQTGRQAEDCLKLDTIFPSYPPEGQLESYCVREFARLTHDPSACEILMPSQAGLDCVGGATRQNTCILEKEYVYWMKDGEQQRIQYEDCPRQYVNEPLTDVSSQCCFISFTALTNNFNDCSGLSATPAMFDECQSQLAFKRRDADSCALIHDMQVRAACTVRVTAMHQDPSICQGCRKPVETVEELLNL